MITIVMGKTGSGKSTYGTIRAMEALKQGIPVYSNVYIAGTHQIDIKDLGTYNIENALIIIDEAGMEFNSRDFKNFTKTLYRFFTLHRHYNLNIILLVQHWSRVDIVLRELVHRIIVVKPTFLKRWLICTHDINCTIYINEQNQIDEKFSWVNPIFGLRYYKVKQARKLFNSFYKDSLQHKTFTLWGILPPPLTFNQKIQLTKLFIKNLPQFIKFQLLTIQNNFKQKIQKYKITKK